MSENAIQLKEDNPQAVEAMIHFMYGFDYDSSGSDHSRVSPMLFNVNVYQVCEGSTFQHCSVTDIDKHRYLSKQRKNLARPRNSRIKPPLLL